MGFEQRGAENSTVTIGTTSTEIFASASNRTYFYIYNGTIGQELTVRLGDGTAVANQGVVLAAGQAYIQSDSEGFRAWRGIITVVADTAGTVVSRQSMVG